MRIISFLIFLLFTSLQAIAQIEAKTLEFSNKLEISLEKDLFQNSLADKIYAATVLDVRDDTGALGYYYITKREALKHSVKPVGGGKKDNKDVWSKIYYHSPTLEQGLTGWINTYLQCRKNDAVKNKLLIVVKKLWLSPEADEVRFDNERTGQALNGWDPGVVIKFDLYLERDSIFYPLYRVDSVFTFKQRLNDYAGFKFVDNSGSFISSALKSSFVKLGNINTEEIIAKRRKLAFKDIIQDYSKKWDIAVLKTTVFKKGAYKDFEEFKTNSPSIKEYELRESELGDILYIKEGNTEYPTRSVWGFSNGTDVFINSGDKYSKLVRRENTFYFFGTKGVVQRSKHDFMRSSALNYANNSGAKKMVYKLDPKYYQLDMETGEAY